MTSPGRYVLKIHLNRAEKWFNLLIYCTAKNLNKQGVHRPKEMWRRLSTWAVWGLMCLQPVGQRKSQHPKFEIIVLWWSANPKQIWDPCYCDIQQIINKFEIIVIFWWLCCILWSLHFAFVVAEQGGSVQLLNWWSWFVHFLFVFVLQVLVAEQGCGVQLLHPHADGIDLWLCEPLASGRVL